VPGDIAIAGFDNLPQCRVTTPPLTSVAYPVQSIAQLAVQNLVGRIEETRQRHPHRILLEPHLVVRESTDPQANSANVSVVSQDQTSGFVERPHS
jgi:LacI family transcriptional regulator, repressor for deo operon, udp, cdd, tsx, nupC, and nupG